MFGKGFQDFSETLDDLEDVLFHRCQSLLQRPDLIRGLTGFHWWLQTGA
ncbi:MAG: hypothetical protein ACKO2Z_37965 [Sphaerospermopsis kisseleviana]